MVTLPMTLDKVNIGNILIPHPSLQPPTPDGQYLITATFVTSTHILVWKTDDLSCAFTLKVPQEEEGIHEIAVSPDGCFLCVAAGNTVYRWLLKWELTV